MATKYYDFIIKGDEDKLWPYLNGYLRGRGVKSGCILTSRHPFKSHFLRELVTYHGEVVHLICRSSVRPAIRAALKAATGEYEWEILDSRSIKKTTFHFEFETANRGEAGAIKRLLGRHPAGAKLVDYEPKEILDPAAKGYEGYAPLHEYTFSGKGAIVGEVEAVLKVHQKLEANPFIHCQEIEIAT